MYLEHLDKIFSLYKEKPAYIDSHGQLTYDELNAVAYRSAAALIESGCMPGKRIAVIMHANVYFAAVCIGIWRAGCTVVPLDPSLSFPEINNMCRHAGVTSYITSGSDEIIVQGIQCIYLEELMKSGNPVRHVDRETPDEFILLFSSGSTGIPKAVCHTEKNIYENTCRNVVASGINENDILLATSIFSSGFGLFSYMCEPLFCGATTIIAYPFHPRLAIKIARKMNITWIQTVPAIISLLLSVNDKLHIPSLRSIILGTATFDEQMRIDIERRFGVIPVQSYGITETGRVALSRNDTNNNKTTLYVLSGIALKILDEEKSELPFGRAGEIAIRTSSLSDTFYLSSDGDREQLPQANGYFLTGDMGIVYEDGGLELLGRIKNIILTPRIKVNPNVVEKVLMRHEVITDAAVFGLPRESGYDLIKAVVVTSGKIDIPEILEFCNLNMPAGHSPHIIEFMDKIPRTILGKVDIEKLKSMT